MAAAGFAEKAAKNLKRVPALRASALASLRASALASLRATALASLRATGASEVTGGAGHVVTLQSQIRSSGIPAELRKALARLGVHSDDLARAKTALLAPSSGGPVLIAPLADPARTRNLQSIASELTAFAKRARRHPISRSRGEPRRFRRH